MSAESGLRMGGFRANHPEKGVKLALDLATWISQIPIISGTRGWGPVALRAPFVPLHAWHQARVCGLRSFPSTGCNASTAHGMRFAKSGDILGQKTCNTCTTQRALGGRLVAASTRSPVGAAKVRPRPGWHSGKNRSTCQPPTLHCNLARVPPPERQGGPPGPAQLLKGF